VPYRRASDSEPDAEEELPPNLVDLSELDRATKRHMELQDRLADQLRGRGLDPRSPGSWQPQFDLAFEHAGIYYVVEVKSGRPVTSQQVRLGVGQVLEYQHLLTTSSSQRVRSALLVEALPPDPWVALADSLGVLLLDGDALGESLSLMLSTA
jgi:hypothetical protein